jgi:nucleotide-binding universal stress UspA family protein
MDGAPPFRRLLVAIDSSSAAQGAFDLACQWVGQHGADVWFLQLTEEHRQRRGAFETDVDPVAVQPANHVVVNGPTQGARSRQLAHGIAEAAAAFHADVIVVGIDHERLTGHRLAPSLRDQITRATALPVLMAPATEPQRSGHRRPLSALEQEAAAPARRYAHV